MQFGISLIICVFNGVKAKENFRSRYRMLHKAIKFVESKCLRVYQVMKKCVFNLVLLLSSFIAANLRN